MSKNLSIVVDYYLEVTGQGKEDYKKHLLPAKQLLFLCNGDTAKAKEVIDEKKSETTDADWSMWVLIKKYL
jgi:hypothetical protein